MELFTFLFLLILSIEFNSYSYKGGFTLKEQNLITSTLLLTATSFLTRTLGMISSVYLAQILGAKGMGIYELVMTLYMTAVIFASAGLCVTVSRMVAEVLGKGYTVQINSIMKVAFSFGLVTSILAALILFIFSPYLCQNFVHDQHAVNGLRILSISIPFIACSSCFKGYFYATKKTIFPASADIIEQIIKVLLIMILLKHYAPKGTTATYSAIGLGLTIGEMVSWSYMLSLFIMDRRHMQSAFFSSANLFSISQLTKKLLRILLPIACISYLGYIFLSIENILIPRGLQQNSKNSTEAIGLLGIIKGMVMPILFFPSAFLTAFTTTLIPEIARANALNLKKRVAYTTSRVLQLTFILSIFVVSVFINYGNEIGFVIYKSEEVGPLLRTLSLIIPFIYVEVIVDGILKALDQQVSCLKYSIIDSIMRVLLIYFLLPVKGIPAFVGIMIISSAFTSTLTFNKLLETIQLKFQPANWLLKPCIAAAFAGSYSRLIINKLLRYSFGLTTKICLGIVLTLLIYIPLLLFIKTLSAEDLSWLKRQLRQLESLAFNVKIEKSSHN